MKQFRKAFKKIKGKRSFVIVNFLMLLFIPLSVQYEVYGQLNCNHLDHQCQISRATKQIEADPKNPVNYFNRALGYRWKGENELAIEDYSKAIELKEDFYQAFYNRSVIYYQLEKTEEAISDIEKVLEINPDVAYAHFFYGFILFQTEDYEAALKSLDRAIEIDPKYKKAYHLRAQVLEKLEKLKKETPPPSEIENT
jgi:tetratricopeptide (TPR) repeat protein